MRWGGASWMLTGLIVLGVSLSVSARLAVMSIDLGGEYMKIAIVKPGVPMEIVLNKESSRKTSTIVAFRDGERHFANEAYNTAVRFPDKAFWFLTHIIGRHYDDPQVQQYRKRFPFYNSVMVKDEERGTVMFKDPDNEDTLYSAEELMGMILEKAREYAQDFAEQEIKDAVITVPAYYNQAERRAIKTAAELVGINVLQLLSDNAAVALNYGVFRRKMFNTTAQYYMFYDMGATSTVASVVSYQLIKTKEGTRVESNPQLTIKGVGYDRNLGGLEMTLRLRDHLAKVFDGQKKRAIKVVDNPRAMAKLLKESERVKKVLSANADHMAQIEGLLDGEDFKAKVTREEFEGLCEDLFERVTGPMEEALRSSEITLGEITEVILMGGSSRVPRVQDILVKYIGRGDLGKSINTDEAAAMGAVYQAAYLGKGFKVKTFHVREANIFPINVEFEKQKSGEDAASASRTIKRTLFSRMNPFPQKKVMTFNKHFSDFTFDVRYGDLDFLPEQERKTFHSLSLTNVSLAGVAEALTKHKEDGSEYKGVKAHFRMDESGILSLDKVESVFEKQQAAEAEKAADESTWSKIGSAFGGLFRGKEDADAGEAKTETPEEEKPSEHAEASQSESSSGQSDQDKSGTDRSEPDTDSTKQEAEQQKAKDKSSEEIPAEKAETSDSSEKEAETPEDKEAETPEDKEAESTDKMETDGDKKDGDEADKKDGDDSDEKDADADKKVEKEETGKDAGKDKKNDTKEEKKPAVPKVVTLKEDIKVDIDVKDVTDLSGDQVNQAKKRLSALRKKDQEKAALLKAKNELEGYIFDMQDKLSQEAYKACSTEEERENIMAKFSEASDWLYEQPEDAKKEVFIDKLKELKDLMKNIAMRVYEKEQRPKVLEALRSHLNHTSTFLETVRNMTDIDDPIFTEVELTTLEKLINETTQWRDEAVKEQAKLPDHKNPSLVVETIGAKIYALEREMKYLINKAKNYRPKPKKDNTTAKANDTDAKKEKDSKSKSEPKEEEEAEMKDDDEDGTVEEEGDDASTITPESQEPAPNIGDKETENTIDTPDVKSEDKSEDKSKPKTEEKKRRPKQKRQKEEEKQTEEEVLELEPAPDTGDKETENTIDTPDVKSEDKSKPKTEEKKRLPKQKRQKEEEKQAEEEVLELGAEDLDLPEAKSDDAHEEL